MHGRGSKMEDRGSKIEDCRGLSSSIFHARSSMLDLRSSIVPLRLLGRDLEERSWKSTLRLWQTRERRYLSWNRSFKPVRSNVAQGYVVRDLDRAVVTELLADPDAPFRRPELKVLKDSCSSIVAEFDLHINGATRRVPHAGHGSLPCLRLLRRYSRRPGPVWRLAAAPSVSSSTGKRSACRRRKARTRAGGSRF